MYGMSGIVPEIYKRMGFETLTVGRVRQGRDNEKGRAKDIGIFVVWGV
jgi:hypothetical protein